MTNPIKKTKGAVGLRPHENTPLVAFAKIKVNFRDVTESYYLYSLSRKKQVDADDNPFSEPVRVYSNLQNGIGIFGLSTKQVFELE